MNKMFSLIGLVFALFFKLACLEASDFEKKSLQELESKIKSLESQKKHCKKRIQKHLHLAQRWQSCEDLTLESRREYSLADHQRDKLRILEQKLEKLKKEAEELRKVG